MAGARPSGTVPMFNEDEEENSADSVEQAALEAAQRDESLLDPDSLMFEDFDEGQQVLDDDDDIEDTVGRTRREADDPTSSDALYDETDSILNTPYGSPLSDISSITSSQKWIGEVKKMLLDDQRQSESRTKAWATSESQALPTLSPSLGAIGIESLDTGQWSGHMEDTMPALDFNMPSAEELAEKYSHDLIEKDLVILEKDKRISNLEKAQRDLEGNLEDCQKELRIKTETATSGVEKLKRTLEEKEKSIMETSERLRKVTESYNSSEKRWKDQQDFLEKQIQKLKSELEEKSSLTEEVERVTEVSRLEKKNFERELREAIEERDLLKQQFAQEKRRLEEELEQLRDEKSALEIKLLEEIEVLQTKLILSEQAAEEALNEKETIRVELESQEEKNRVLSLNIVELQSKDEIISLQDCKRMELEKIIAELREEINDNQEKFTIQQQELQAEKESILKEMEQKQEKFTTEQQELQVEKESLLKEMEKKQEEFAITQRELEVEKESMRKEIEEVKQRVELDDDTPVNFFKQSNDATTTESWTETQKALEDRIAELELEKGNLLLQLVDVDEHEQQEAQKNAAITAVAEKNAKQLEAMKEAFEEFQRNTEELERELEETRCRESTRIETAMNTIAWEEKYDELQKENEALLSELQSQRKAADELSGKYEELEKKVVDLELEKPPIEGLVEIDKCDGWSDGTPQLPDEGFTEMEAQISELKTTLDEKQRQIDEILLMHKEAEDKLVEKSLMVSQYEAKIEEISADKSSYFEKLQECTKELERTRQELLEKTIQQEAVLLPASAEAADGWNDDAPVLLDEGFNEDNQIAELKQELSKKTQELSTTTDRCKQIEDKLKKALKALKQKNDKLAELKSRLGDDSMNTSSVSPMEASMVVEPLVGKSVASDTSSSPTLHLEIDRWKRECESKDSKIKELENAIKVLQDEHTAKEALAVDNKAELASVKALVAQRDLEIASFRIQLTQLATTLGSKNEEVVKLMRACEDLQQTVDDKVELLNECVSRKDVEVRQAISQYEDFLKDATLNVSHLTKELEEKIRMINSLQAQLQDAQEQLLMAQNEFDNYKGDSVGTQDIMERKDEEIDDLKTTEAQLREELHHLNVQLNEAFNSHSLMNEALDRAEAEKKQLREESVCIQNEYGNKNRELQVQISQLIDQLNERETAISVMEARLKESDEVSDKMANEIKYQLEEKSKILEQTEQSLFVKTEDCVRLEERLRETEESYRREMETKILELQDQHRVSLEAYASQTSDDLERTCEQLAKKNSEVAELQEKCSQLHEQLTKVEGDYNNKCSEVSQAEQLVAEINMLKSTVQTLEASISSYTQALSAANADVNAKSEEIANLQMICGQYEEKSYNSAMAQEGVQRTLHETQSALAQCQHDLGTYYNELQNSKMEVEMLRNSQGEYQQTLEKVNAELNEAKTEVSLRKSEIERLTNQVSKYVKIEENTMKYIEDLNAATEELGKRNSEYRELEKTCKTQEKQIETLNANAEVSRDELAEADKKMSAKDDRITELLADIDKLAADSKAEEGLSEKTKELLEELEEKNREISDLRFELEEGIIQEKRLKENLHSREEEVKQLLYEMDEKEKQMEESWQTLQTVQNTPLVREEDGPIIDRLEKAEKEKEALERKIDLLQNKLEEVESSEVKCYEDFSRLKVLRTELEMDNLRMSAELEQLRRSIQDGDNDPKYKSMENQLILMTKTLEDRDKLCRDLMKNISQLQESYDALRIRINSTTTPQPFDFSPDGLEAKFVEQDREIFSLRVDLEREKKIRELYEGQLFLATSKKQFENSTRKSTSTGSWFGLGELFSSPSPPPRRPSPSPSTRSSVSTSLAAPPAQSFESYLSSPGRPVTPLTPATPYSSSVFDNSGQAGHGQQYLASPQMSPRHGEGTQPAQSSSSNVVESPYANFPSQP